MDLNAYVLAMAIVAAARHRKNQHTVPEPGLTPFDLTELTAPYVNINQPRHSSHNGKTWNNVSEAVPA